MIQAAPNVESITYLRYFAERDPQDIALLQLDQYADSFFLIEPYQAIPRDEALVSDCAQRTRTPRETKGQLFKLNDKKTDECCGGNGSC